MIETARLTLRPMRAEGTDAFGVAPSTVGRRSNVPSRTWPTRPGTATVCTR